MQDEQMLDDLRAFKYKFHLESADKLEQNGVRTYSDLFNVLRDPTADVPLKVQACWAISSLHKIVDGRKAIPLLLKQLNAESYELRRAAVHTLGYWKTRRVADVLIERAESKLLETLDRIDALYILSMFKHERLNDIFRTIMLDEGEDFRLRSEAIEWFPSDENMLDTWIQFLHHENADLRFWAIFRLTSRPWQEQRQALSVLDKIAAYDDALPKAFGWKVSREALKPLEDIYAFSYYREEYPDDEWDDLSSCNYPVWLISPAPEYWDFQQKYRRWNADWIYEDLPLPTFDLRIEAHWLRDEIGKAWAGVEFGVRAPKPETYLIDWHLKINGMTLLGGLHRDQYSLVLTGRAEAVYAFAAWYRSIIAQDHRLYLYGWADPGVELTFGITPAQIEKAAEDVFKATTYTPETTE